MNITEHHTPNSADCDRCKGHPYGLGNICAVCRVELAPAHNLARRAGFAARLIGESTDGTIAALFTPLVSE